MDHKNTATTNHALSMLAQTVIQMIASQKSGNGMLLSYLLESTLVKALIEAVIYLMKSTI